MPHREPIYLALVFALLVIPRVLQRWKIPAPLTCIAFGIGAMLAWGDKVHDPVVTLLSMLGISSLFLFAGLEVDLRALRARAWPLLAHLSIRACAMVAVAWLAWRYAGMNWQVAGLLALALLTPSTGFILDTLDRLGLDEGERFWVTNKAIAGELLALAALFVVLQADDPVRLGVSTLSMLALLVGLPLLFMAFGRWLVPYAPGSEFSLLVMVGFVAAFVTFELGVYYLVGAFIAGLVARLLRARMPKLTSNDNIHALRLFATFFVPFYFFHAGTGVSRDALGWEALVLGVAITLVVLPLRIAVTWLQRRLFFGENASEGLRVSVALAPTLVFTLVLAEILHSRFGMDDALFGALLLYAALNTLLPSLVLHATFDVDPIHGAVEATDAPMGEGNATHPGEQPPPRPVRDDA